MPTPTRIPTVCCTGSRQTRHNFVPRGPLAGVMALVRIGWCVAALAFVCAAPAAAKGPSCRRAPADAPVKQTPRIRAYQLDDGTEYACERRRGARPWIIGLGEVPFADRESPATSSGTAGLLEAAGRFVAFDEENDFYGIAETT